MKSWLVISLILSSFILHEAQGMSLRRGSLPDKINLHLQIGPLEGNNDGTEEDKVPTNIHQAPKISGRSRKLIVTHTSSTTKTAKNVKRIEENKDLPKSEGSSNKEKIGKNEEKMSVNSSLLNQASPETYPDVMDIAGMDYSQTRRRPPIHN